MAEDNQTNTPQVLTPTSGREYRKKKKPFLLKVSPSLTVLMKPIQMEDSFFHNLIPMPALTTKEKFDELEARLKGTTLQEIMSDPSKMGDILENKELNMLDYLRRYACAAVIEPQIVMVDDGNEDHIPVTELTRLELLTIFNAEGADQQPFIDPGKVEEFRRPEQAQDGHAVPLGENVRSKTKLVDLGKREAISA